MEAPPDHNDHSTRGTEIPSTRGRHPAQCLLSKKRFPKHLEASFGNLTTDDRVGQLDISLKKSIDNPHMNFFSLRAQILCTPSRQDVPIEAKVQAGDRGYQFWHSELRIKEAMNPNQSLLSQLQQLQEASERAVVIVWKYSTHHS